MNLLNQMAYHAMGWWDIENGSVYCLYFQGWGSPVGFALEVLVCIIMLVLPIVVIILIVKLVKWLRRRKKKRQNEEDIK